MKNRQVTPLQDAILDGIEQALYDMKESHTDTVAFLLGQPNDKLGFLILIKLGPVDKLTDSMKSLSSLNQRIITH